MTKPAPLPRMPSPPRPQKQALTKMEQYYLAVLMHWYRYRPGIPPSCDKLGEVCRPRKSHTAVRSALLSLESKGYVLRNADGKFEVLP